MEKFEIKNRVNGKVLFSCKAESFKTAVELAVKEKIDLKSANLKYANLEYVNLKSANLEYANLEYANLFNANLKYANLKYANLKYANLEYAYLKYANLKYADLDFSCFPLWCGSFKMKAGTRLIWQLIAHIGRLDTSLVSDKAKIAIKQIEPYFNEFCRYRDDVEKI